MIIFITFFVSTFTEKDHFMLALIKRQGKSYALTKRSGRNFINLLWN